MPPLSLAHETTTETLSPGREPAAGPLHTATVVCLGTAPFLFFYCGVSGGHCIDVFVLNIVPCSPSFILVCIFGCVFLGDLCLCLFLSKLSFMRKVKRKTVGREGLLGRYRLCVGKSTVQNITRKTMHTQSRIHSPFKTVWPSLKMTELLEITLYNVLMCPHTSYV